jgi:hypothetical protein
MVNLTESLTKSEITETLALIQANGGLTIDQLTCEFTRQQDAGTHVSPNGRKWAISYDLSLCKLCGNLEPQQPACPAKLRIVRERLLNPVTKTIAN